MTMATMPQVAPREPPAPASGQRAEHIDPTLTPVQLARIAAQGRRRHVALGEVLVQAGEQTARLFVVVAGRIDVVRPSPNVEEVMATFGPGMFTGEVTMLSGRRGLAQIRAGAVGEVIEVSRDDLLALIQTDGELSEILMRAFILRRVELISRGVSDVVVLGSSHCQGTLRIREFLTRNGHPHTMVGLDRDAGVEALLARFQIRAADVPVVICRCDVVLRNPTNQQIADALGFNDAIDQTHVRDLVIVGAGPSGLAAAGYGASGGLEAPVVGAAPPGGPAGAGSPGENYPRVSVGGGRPAGAYADPLGGPGRHHVALPDPSHRRPSGHRAPRAHGDREPRGERPPRAGGLARQPKRAYRDTGNPACLRHDGRGAQHALAGRLPRTRRQGVHQDGTGSVAGGPGHGTLAARARAPSPRDESPRGLRDRRRPRRELEACGIGGGRGIDRDRRGASGAA